MKKIVMMAHNIFFKEIQMNLLILYILVEEIHIQAHDREVDAPT